MSASPRKSETNVPVRSAMRHPTQHNPSHSNVITMPQTVSQLMDNFFNFWPAANTSSQDMLPALSQSPFQSMSDNVPVIDVIEHKKSFTVKAELPGIEVGNITIEAGDNYITLQTDQEDCTLAEDGNYLYNECSGNSYERVIMLPEYIDSEKAHAEFKNGILTIFAHKKTAQMPKGKTVPIKEAA